MGACNILIGGDEWSHNEDLVRYKVPGKLRRVERLTIKIKTSPFFVITIVAVSESIFFADK